jgi:lauroyl/myristoyl acyltransferase
MGVRLRQVEATPRANFTKDDALFCIELPVLWVISWVASERAWKTCCYFLEWTKWRLGFFSVRTVADAVSRILSEVAGQDNGHTFALRHAASRSEHHLQILRTYRPGGWTPEIALEGREHLKQALEQGKGAVLWVAHFSFNALAAKMAVAKAGFDVAHLSRPEHGFSKSRFGIRVLNPIRVKAELCYLADRIIIDRALPGGAKRAAEKLLRANGIVSITAGAWEGRSVASVNLLGATMELATGAPALADACGAVLLPIFTVREEATGVIKVIVQEPIAKPIESELPVRLAKMTQDFANRMEPFILAYPEQWRDWKSLKFT